MASSRTSQNIQAAKPNPCPQLKRYDSRSVVNVKKILGSQSDDLALRELTESIIILCDTYKRRGTKKFFSPIDEQAAYLVETNDVMDAQLVDTMKRDIADFKSRYSSQSDPVYKQVLANLVFIVRFFITPRAVSDFATEFQRFEKMYTGDIAPHLCEIATLLHAHASSIIDIGRTKNDSAVKWKDVDAYTVRENRSELSILVIEVFFSLLRAAYGQLNAIDHTELLNAMSMSSVSKRLATWVTTLSALLDERQEAKERVAHDRHKSKSQKPVVESSDSDTDDSEEEASRRRKRINARRRAARQARKPGSSSLSKRKHKRSDDDDDDNNKNDDDSNSDSSD